MFPYDELSLYYVTADNCLSHRVTPGQIRAQRGAQGLGCYPAVMQARSLSQSVAALKMLVQKRSFCSALRVRAITNLHLSYPEKIYE